MAVSHPSYSCVDYSAADTSPDLAAETAAVSLPQQVRPHHSHRYLWTLFHSDLGGFLISHSCLGACAKLQVYHHQDGHQRHENRPPHVEQTNDTAEQKDD